MRDVNTMSKFGYVLENLIWSLLVVRIYKMHCFTNFLSCNYETSNRILYIMVVCFVPIGVLLTIKMRRNSINTAINVAFPFAIYTIFAYINYLWLLILLSLIAACIGGAAYVVMTNKYSRSATSNRNKTFTKKRFCLLGIRAISTVCCSFVVIYLAGTSLTGIQLYRPSENAETTSSSFEEYIEDNKDELSMLDESKWQQLSIGSKLNVLQLVCNAEAKRLGIQHPIYIKSKVFENDLLGEYIESEKTVLINTKLLNEGTVEEVITCITHECFHSYQHNLVNLYNSVNDEQKHLAVFDKAREYKDEFADYKGGDCFDEYYNQTVESDSRNYSEYAANIYIRSTNS